MRVGLLLFVILFLISCTEHATIHLKSYSLVEGIGDSYQDVSSIGLSEKIREAGPYWRVELESDYSFERGVEKKYVFLYHRLSFCDHNQSTRIHGWQAYILDDENYDRVENRTYFAFIPFDIRDSIISSGWHPLESEDIESSSVCLQLGAGNMSFGRVISNKVQLEFLN